MHALALPLTAKDTVRVLTEYNVDKVMDENAKLRAENIALQARVRRLDFQLKCAIAELRHVGAIDYIYTYQI
jgi:hypothetical protein